MTTTDHDIKQLQARIDRNCAALDALDARLAAAHTRAQGGQ